MNSIFAKPEQKPNKKSTKLCRTKTEQFPRFGLILLGENADFVIIVDVAQDKQCNKD